MAVPSSGELELYGDIGTELGVAQSNVTLHGMSQTAGFTPPDAMSEFYGYSNITTTTLNPSDISNGSLSSGNLRFTSTSTPWSLCRTIVGVTSGKYYFEMYVHSATNNSLGIGIAESTLVMNGSLWGQSAGGINYYGQNGIVFENGSNINTYATYGAGTTLMCAFDMTAGKIWFGKNGTWNGDPANGTSPASSIIKNYITTAKPFANAYYVSNSVEMNFGSGNSVNSGGFTYTPPSGFGPILS